MVTMYFFEKKVVMSFSKLDGIDIIRLQKRYGALKAIGEKQKGGIYMWTVYNSKGEYVCETWNKAIAEKYASLVNGKAVKSEPAMYSVNDNQLF